MALPPAAHPPSSVPVRAAIVDYEFGNVRSVANALQAVGAEVTLTRDEALLASADCLVLPGVGAFAQGMAHLQRLGLVDMLECLVLKQKKPFLGICVGMQLLAESSEEDGLHPGLGWMPGRVKRFESTSLKIPHMGWNEVEIIQASPLANVGERHCYYFVHSYHWTGAETSVITGVCEYGAVFPAVLKRENIVAVQFHPEKSQKAGLALLSRFLESARPTQAQSGIKAASC